MQFDQSNLYQFFSLLFPSNLPTPPYLPLEVSPGGILMDTT